MTRCVMLLVSLAACAAAAAPSTVPPTVPSTVPAQPVRVAIDTSAIVQPVAGCYALTMGAWSGPLPATGIPAAHQPPERFSLDTAELPGPFPGRHAVRPSALTGRGRMPASWNPLAPDSIRVSWSTGYVGVVLLLGVRGDTLAGTALAFHDGHFEGEPPDPSAPVVAVRVACSPEPAPRDDGAVESALAHMLRR